MKLERFVAAIVLGLALSMTLVWQRHQSVRYRVALNETRDRAASVERENHRLVCTLESKTLPRELIGKVTAMGIPLLGPEIPTVVTADRR